MPKRPVTLEDVFRFKLLSDPQCSPDGKFIAFVQTTPNLEQDKNISHIWLAPADGSAPPRQFTFSENSETAPRWSPNGQQLAFLSDRKDKKNQLFVINVTGGEARQLTNGETSPSAAIWSPDGTRIAYTQKVITDAVKKANGWRKDSDVKSYTRLVYRFDGEGYWDYGWRQLFVMTVSDGKAHQLTRGDYNHADPAWSPDGQMLVFSANRKPRPDEHLTSDLWLVPATGGALKQLTHAAGPSTSPAFSPDGKQIAYLGHDSECSFVTLTKLYLIDRNGGHRRCLTADFDRSAGDSLLNDMRGGNGASVTPQWSKDGKQLYFLSTNGGTSNVYTVSARGGKVKTATRGNHQLIGWSYANGQLAYVASEFTNPNDLYVASATGANVKRLTRVNADVLKELTLASATRVEFRAPDGGRIEGWVVKPSNFKAGKKYPTILSIHGGPQSTYGYSYFHEFQLLSAAGYGVLFTNPRGGGGYGQAFMAAIRQDWGGSDYTDLMMALDSALEKFPWMDAKRLGVSGGSYGGYMTTWIITHNHRFKAAIAERGLLNWYSFSGTSDIGHFFGPAWNIGGQPWDNAEAYLAHSPIAHVHHCKTPTLLIYQTEDHRCPTEQTEQFYSALKKLHVPTMLVQFPNESHGLSRGGKPKHRKERYERSLAWLAQYVKR